uniref:RecA-like N-terminal domain-containing protein n=1 Tax=Aegilops tauschii subsp. strangulata TaxID=200361 RepID=A0A453GLN1_AEGTS
MVLSLSLQVISIEILICAWSASPGQGVHLSFRLVLLSLISLLALEVYQRMVEIFGKESSGKTTLALHVIKEAQKNGGYCAYIDAENAFNTSFAEEVGVDIDKLLIAQPDSAENSLSIVNTLVGGSIDVVVVDSVCYFTMPFSDILCFLYLILSTLLYRVGRGFLTLALMICTEF